VTVPDPISPFLDALLPVGTRQLAAHANAVTCVLVGRTGPLRLECDGRRVDGDILLVLGGQQFQLNNGTIRQGVTFTTSRQFNLIGTGTIETTSAATYNGKFSGAGGLVKSGSQTGTFTANNDFTGSLFIVPP